MVVRDVEGTGSKHTLIGMINITFSSLVDIVDISYKKNNNKYIWLISYIRWLTIIWKREYLYKKENETCKSI